MCRIFGRARRRTMPTETRTKPLDRLLRAASNDPDPLVSKLHSNSPGDLVVGHPVVEDLFVEDLVAASKVVGAEVGVELV